MSTLRSVLFLGVATLFLSAGSAAAAAQKTTSRSECALNLVAAGHDYTPTDATRTQALLQSQGFNGSDIATAPLDALALLFLFLPRNERLIVTLRYGLDGTGERNWKEVTAILVRARLQKGRTVENTRLKAQYALALLRQVAPYWPLDMSGEPPTPQSIFELPLNPNTARALVRCGYFTVWRLTQQTSETLLQCPRIDTATVVQIVAALRRKKLTLAEPAFIEPAARPSSPDRPTTISPAVYALATLSEADRDVLPISRLEFGPRATRAMQRLGIRWVGDLRGLSETKLQPQANFGPKTLEEVRLRMQAAGLTLPR